MAPAAAEPGAEVAADGSGAAAHVRAVLGRALARVGGASWETIATGVVVASCALFVFMTVQPRLIFTENTPTGGDMGSHVWGPMFLMREALPHGQLNAWAPDWYAGFPAFQFYMVLPMLAIVVVHVGVWGPLLALALPAALAVVPLGWFVPRLERFRWLLFGVGLFLTVLVVPVPYGIAFKLVAVSGLVGLPVAAWALGRLSGAPFPVPPALALGSLFFLYNLEPTLNSGTGNIIGGNLTSTMAGEFSFSISLTLGVLYLGFLVRGLRTGRGRGLTAVLLALTGLCHIIPAFYVLGATAVALVVWPGVQRLRWFLPVGPVAGLLAAWWVLPFAGRHAYVNDMGWEPLPHTNGGDTRTVWAYLDTPGRAVAVLLVAALMGGAAAVVVRTGVGGSVARAWAAVVAAAGAGAFVGGAAVPIVLSHVTAVEAGLGPAQTTAEGSAQTVFSYLLPASDALDIPLLVAAVGLVVGIVFHQRLAYLLAAMAAGGALGFVVVPDARLWNARLLPLYYLSLFLLAALGVAEVVRAASILVSRDPERPTPWLGVGLAMPAVLAVVVFLGGPLALDQLPTGGTNAKGEAELAGIARTYRNPGSSWAEFNFKGLEGQPAKTGQADGAAVPNGQGGWPEFRALVATMADLGADEDHGCGRAFWEFDRDRVQSYGTTMAPMMIPYFTDGCIGSMEGLYFESSTTTPYHFITQCKLSKAGSCSQRDLAYTSFDIDRGVSQLELMGVRYYLAATDTAVQAAAADGRLTEVAVTGPWHVFEVDAVAESEMVVALDHLPVVLDNVEPIQDSWLDPAIAWFNDPERWDVPFAIDGPDEWPRVSLPDLPLENADGTTRRYGDRDLPDFPAEEVRAAEVTDVVVGDESLSFHVDQPGTPVLVKMSYFPNWRVEGAEGPYRVSPNLMVLVPTANDVTMTYGRTPLDWAAYLLTFLGLLALLGFWRFGPVPIPEGVVARRRRERVEAATAAAAAATGAATAFTAGHDPPLLEPVWGEPSSGPPAAGPPPGGPVDPVSPDGAVDASAAEAAATAADVTAWARPDAFDEGSHDADEVVGTWTPPVVDAPPGPGTAGDEPTGDGSDDDGVPPVR